MKIISLKISKLHGVFDYNVAFNTDVTFIYGLNGCGKTTILNITEAIITGQLFKLFNYKFESIELNYAKNGNILKIKSLTITNISKDTLSVNFNNKSYEIAREYIREESENLKRNLYEYIKIYFSKYPILDEIKKTFNYVYLPLNRSSLYNNDDWFIKWHSVHRSSNFTENMLQLENQDLSMLEVEGLIYDQTSRINFNISKINDEFRNKILKSLLEMKNVTNDSIAKTLIEIIGSKDFINDIEETKNAYLKMLNDLKLLNEEEEDNYKKFFANLIEGVDKFSKKRDKISMDLILKFQEYTKIKKLISISKSMEESKAKEREPIDVFVKTMNEFVSSSDDEKRIDIDDFGRVYFTTKYNKGRISIQHMSSGEKQLITFFANLIFKVKKGTSGIFVVDEPELSLHLLWQKKFVEKALSINGDLQLIFATHAPEIIGEKRNKMFKLEKKSLDWEGK